MAVQEINVEHKYRDVKGQGLRREVQTTLGFDPGEIRTKERYFVQGITKRKAGKLARQLLADPILQKYRLDQDQEGGSKKVTVAYKPGVMDPEGEAIKTAAGILEIYPQAVGTSTEYSFSPYLSDERIAMIKKRLLINTTVQQELPEKPKTLTISGSIGPVKDFPLPTMSEDELLELSKKEELSCDLKEMKAIQAESIRLRRNFTDVETGVIGQSWSDHCKHKSFNADIYINGIKKPSLMSRIRETSLRFSEKFLRAFDGNAGIIPFFDGWAISAKGETHNHPVGLDPYGGAMTRSGGVERDEVAENGEDLFGFDIDCFGPPDMPMEEVPEGRHHPAYLLRQNFYGIRDYGNRMGIPTVRTKFVFHKNFRACVVSLGIDFGIVPENKTKKMEPEVGDLIISAGGRTGRDGINGATMSSMSATDKTITVGAASVQIGNPIEQKRVFDALLECRDQDLYTAITDCGGGGYSSAIGELGQNLGVEVHLDRIKVKYPGLSPKERILSEAQERMIIAAKEENLPRLQQIFEKHNVEMTTLGTFTGEKKFTLRYEGQVVCDLDMDFLHHGVPKRKLEGHWNPPQKDERQPDLPIDWVEAYKKVLGHWNVCSVEPIVRQFDHGVKGMTVLAPFTGVNQEVLNDGFVAAPLYGKPYGIVATNSLNPILNMIDPYEASIWVAADALAKFTAVGGDYKRAGLIDNYIWPKLDTSQNVASIDMATDGLCDSMKAGKDPCVSGKDSVSSSFTSDGKRIDILPVLNITIFGGIPDAEKTVSLDFKKIGSTICLVGKIDKANLAGSIYYDTCGLEKCTNMPKVNINDAIPVMDKVLSAIQNGEIHASHAISTGGFATTLAEMCFEGGCGAKINLSNIGSTRPDFLFFNATSGAMLVEVDSSEKAEELFKGIPYVVIGKTQKEKEIDVNYEGRNLFTADLEEIRKPYIEKMRGVIG